MSCLYQSGCHVESTYQFISHVLSLNLLSGSGSTKSLADATFDAHYQKLKSMLHNVIAIKQQMSCSERSPLYRYTSNIPAEYLFTFNTLL